MDMPPPGSYTETCYTDKSYSVIDTTCIEIGEYYCACTIALVLTMHFHTLYNRD